PMSRSSSPIDWWSTTSQPSGCWAPCTWRCSSTKMCTEFWKLTSRSAFARPDRAPSHGRPSASAAGLMDSKSFNPEPAATVASVVHAVAAGSELNALLFRENLRQRGCQRIHFFRVQDLIVALKKSGKRRLVDFHFGVADADSAVADNAVALLG